MLNLHFKNPGEFRAAYLPFVKDGALTTIITEKPSLGETIDVNITLPESDINQRFQGTVVLTHKQLDGTYKIGIQLTDKINQLII